MKDITTEQDKKALDNLNKVIDEREKMIYAILDHRQKCKSMTDAQFDYAEKRLLNSSYSHLKRIYVLIECNLY